MRIKSRDGHLSNEQSLKLLQQLNQNGLLKHIVLGHLSEENNDRKIVEKLFNQYKTEENHKFKITIANQSEPTEIFDV